MTSAPTRTRASQGGSFRFAGGTLDRARRELRIHDVPRRLEPRVFDVLWHLLERQGLVVTRDELLREFWPHEDTTDGALSRVIMKLRRALGRGDPANGCGLSLSTIHRFGYRLDAQALVHEPPTVFSPGSRAPAGLQSPETGFPLAAEPRPWDQVRSELLHALESGPPSDARIDTFSRALADEHRSVDGADLLEQLRLEEQAGRLALAAYGHFALAHARMNRMGVDAYAQTRLEDAARLAERCGQAALSFQIQVTLANIELQRGGVAVARAQYESLLRTSDIQKHPVQGARLMNNLGILDAMAGNVVGARSRFERTVRVCRRERFDELLLCAASNLAMMQVDMACISDAVETIESVLDRMPHVQPPRLAADMALTACCVFAEAATPGRMEPLLRLFSTWEPDDRHPVQVLCLVATALYQAAHGDDRGAAASLRRAVLLAQQSQERMRVAEWAGLWMRAALRAGDSSALQEALAFGRVHGPSDARFAGEERHAAAAALHLQGRPDEALRQLDDALGHLSPGRTAGRVRHDAAWLCIERGALAEGQALLREVPNWQEEHPLGWKLRARLRAGEGDFQGATLWQQRLLDRLGPCASPYDHRLLQIYAFGPSRDDMPPPTPRLPSLMLPSL